MITVVRVQGQTIMVAAVQAKVDLPKCEDSANYKFLIKIPKLTETFFGQTARYLHNRCYGDSNHVQQT
jgi:hypothetical protein